MEGPNSFRECTEVAESLGCIVKLRGRSDSKRSRGNYLTIHMFWVLGGLGGGEGVHAAT